MKEARVLLGVVAAPHGVRGLVRIRSFTEDPMAIASYGALSDETGKTRYRVEALSTVKGAVLARIEGVADRNAAEALRGLRLYVERERLPATGEREWYQADLIGLPAVGTDGRDWGKVMAFHDFGAGPDDGGLGRHGVTPVGDAAFHRRSGARGRRRRRQGRGRSAGRSAGGRQREGGVGPTCGALWR